jgi:hypothetical protein
VPERPGPIEIDSGRIQDRDVEIRPRTFGAHLEEREVPLTPEVLAPMAPERTVTPEAAAIPNPPTLDLKGSDLQAPDLQTPSPPKSDPQAPEFDPLAEFRLPQADDSEAGRERTPEGDIPFWMAELKPFERNVAEPTLAERKAAEPNPADRGREPHAREAIDDVGTLKERQSRAAAATPLPDWGGRTDPPVSAPSQASSTAGSGTTPQPDSRGRQMGAEERLWEVVFPQGETERGPAPRRPVPQGSAPQGPAAAPEFGSFEDLEEERSRWKAPALWAAVVLVAVACGWVLFGLLRHPGKPSGETAQSQAGARTPVVQDPSFDAALMRWVSSFRDRNIQAQMACYAPHVTLYFGRHNVSLKAIQSEKARAWGNLARVGWYDVSPLSVTDAGNGRKAVVVRKEWDTTSTRGAVSTGSWIERLVFQRMGGDWKIVEEQEIKDLPPGR